MHMLLGCTILAGLIVFALERWIGCVSKAMLFTFLHRRFSLSDTQKFRSLHILSCSVVI